MALELHATNTTLQPCSSLAPQRPPATGAFPSLSAYSCQRSGRSWLRPLFRRSPRNTCIRPNTAGWAGRLSNLALPLATAVQLPKLLLSLYLLCKAIGWFLGRLDLRYTDLQSLVKCLDHRCCDRALGCSHTAEHQRRASDMWHDDAIGSNPVAFAALSQTKYTLDMATSKAVQLSSCTALLPT